MTPIVKYFLALIATSVPCESLFSQCGIIVTELRNRISSFLLEDLTLLKENNFFNIKQFNFFTFSCNISLILKFNKILIFENKKIFFNNFKCRNLNS